MVDGIGLTLPEVHAAFEADGAYTYLPILGPGKFAELAGVSVNTIYHWLEHGQFHGCHRRRGKHQLIWRDRARTRGSPGR
jgi:hypothetical protein